MAEPKQYNVYDLPERKRELTEERVLAIIDAYVNSPAFKIRSGLSAVSGGWAISSAGVFTTSQQIISTLATGTAPFDVTSTTLNTNLNADQVDGYDLNQSVTTTGTPTFSSVTATSFIIGANTLTTTEWANLDGINQTVATTSTPSFTGLLATDKIKLTQTDGNEYIDSLADGYVDIGATTATRFNMSAADTDVRTEYVGTSNTGVLTWMEDEDYFRFDDDIYPYERLLLPMGEVSYFDTTGTTITISAQSDGSTNMVVVNPTTALSGNAFETDNGGSNNGRLRYTGTTTKHFHCAATISIASTGANDTFVIGFAKNGTVIAASKCLQKITTSGDTQSTALHVMAELATNDYLELYVGNITDTDNFVIKTMNIFAMGI